MSERKQQLSGEQKPTRRRLISWEARAAMNQVEAARCPLTLSENSYLHHKALYESQDCELPDSVRRVCGSQIDSWYYQTALWIQSDVICRAIFGKKLLSNLASRRVKFRGCLLRSDLQTVLLHPEPNNPLEGRFFIYFPGLIEICIRNSPSRLSSRLQKTKRKSSCWTT